MGTHLIDGEFQSDKYPTTPRGKVPLSTRDPTAQDLLWTYAQRRRDVDAEFSDDLESALVVAGYQPESHAAGGVITIVTEYETHRIPRSEVRHVSVRPNSKSTDPDWILTYQLASGPPRSIWFSEPTMAKAMMGLLAHGTDGARIEIRRVPRGG